MRSKQPAQRLLSSSSQVLFAPSPADNNLGHLLFLRDNALYSQPFDASRLAITGDAIALIASVGAGAPGQGEAGRSNSGFFSTSSNGVLVFRPGSAIPQQLTWLNRRGMSLGTVGDAGGYTELDLSPDGKRLAAVRNGDIWTIELDRNLITRFTLDGSNRAPVWSRDGSRIAFESDRDGIANMFVKPAEGGPQELLYKADEQDSPTDFAPDGQSLIFTSTRKSGTDVFLLPLAAGFKPSPPAVRWRTHSSRKARERFLPTADGWSSRPVKAGGMKRMCVLFPRGRQVARLEGNRCGISLAR
jgi:dipeptidyl aminopeptidase/acylaminoacyl peptidase